MTTSQAKEYFFHLHDVQCNQKYNKTLPYSFHLQMVENQAFKFDHLISDDKVWDAVLAGVWGHDSLEDCHSITYNDIKEKFGPEVAEIIYLCKEWNGRTRAERHCAGYWQALATDKLAVFVKLCDVMANVKFSLLSNSSMFDRYKKEYVEWKPVVYREECKEMFDYLESLFSINQ